MIQYEQDGAMQTLDIDDYYIQTDWDGSANLLHFSMPVRHPQMLAIAERTQLYESDSGQVYRVSKYDRGRSTLDIDAELDLDALCAGVLLSWDNTTASGDVLDLGATVSAILAGTGWTLDDQSGRTDAQQMATFSGTVLEAITAAVELWGNDLGVQYDNAQKVVHLYSASQRQPTGCYLTEDLNLLETPQVKGKAERGAYYNRLYLIGADGLMLPAPYYVESRAAGDPIVSHVEENGDIADAAALLTTAQEMVAAAARASRSYTCKVADLERLRPDAYAHLKLGLYDTVILIDRDDYSRSYQTISRLRRYPLRPEKNEVTLATVPGTLSATAGTTYSLARTAASQAYTADKQTGTAAAAALAAQQAAATAASQAATATQAAASAATTATAYISDAGGTVTFGRTSAGSAVSVQARADGLQFNGVRNGAALWTNPDPAAGMAAGAAVQLDLASYAAVQVGFLAAAPAENPADGAAPGPVQFVTAAVNGVEQRAVCLAGSPTARTCTVSASAVTFGAGSALGADGAMADDPAACVPYIIYGFL